MGKTIKGKDKAARKVAAARRKIARKCKGCAAIMIGGICAAVVAGCSTSDAAQPAKANTMENTFSDCIIVVATHASVSNRIVTAEGTKDAPAVELFTQTQSLENTGSTDSIGQTATQTPTTDVKPDIDANYNDAVATGGGVLESFLATLTPDSASALKKLVSSGKDGSLVVTKADGTTDTVTCKGGSCSDSSGTCLTGKCSD